jgi:hypothetical protein
VQLTFGNLESLRLHAQCCAVQRGLSDGNRRLAKRRVLPPCEAILALKPVTFHYKTDNYGTPQFGLIAEDVAKVNPDLVVRDENGEIYTVRYDAVNAMLLNKFLKEHRRVQVLAEMLTQQQKQFRKTIAQHEEKIELLSADLRKTER